MTVPVYQAYLNAQLQVIHEKIVEIWKLGYGADDVPSKLWKQIEEATKLLPAEYRKPGMPPIDVKPTPKRQTEDDFEDLLG